MAIKQVLKWRCGIAVMVLAKLATCRLLFQPAHAVFLVRGSSTWFSVGGDYWQGGGAVSAVPTNQIEMWLQLVGHWEEQRGGYAMQCRE